jgi:HK97 family phage major capsid protein/HK97 family phage prohead protease
VLHRVCSLLHVKALEPTPRRITGVATTPEPDRRGDIIEPLGVSFRNPLPLLLHHDPKQPVGTAIFRRPTADGVEFDATLAEIDEPGPLRDRINEAWQSIKAGLITGVSIGFRELESTVLKGGGLRFLRSEVVELSLVTIPANAQASILTIKQLAATGPHSPGAAGLPLVRAMKDAPAMTISEQITQWSNARAPLAARLAELMAKSAEKGETLDEAEAEEFDGIEVKIKTIDAQLTRARSAEQLQIAAAVPVMAKTAAEGSALRSPVPHVTVKANVAPGTAFVRYVCAALVCKGNLFEAAEYAKRWDTTTPEVSLQLKAAVAAGTATDATWAGPLVNQTIAADFLELLRPATILGKIPGLRRVPFNTKIPAQSAGGTYGWVGEGKPKPVTALAFSAETLGITKAAGIIVLTEELVRLSSPSAEALAREDMIAGIAQFLDQQFIDPAVAAVAGVRPASITNGATTAVATTNPLADLMTLLNHFATQNLPIEGVTLIMSQANALAMSFQTNLDGSPVFPGVGITGGTAKGMTIVTSQAAGSNVIALQPNRILFADDGGVTIDASREASLQMDSAPESPVTATTVLVSLWQHNMVGLRAERFVNWKRVGNSVIYLTAAAYPAPSGMTLMRTNGGTAAVQRPPTAS